VVLAVPALKKGVVFGRAVPKRIDFVARIRLNSLKLMVSGEARGTRDGEIAMVAKILAGERHMAATSVIRCAERICSLLIESKGRHKES
jgi:hypothetical protein